MTENRIRERHVFDKHILCYRCDSETHIKVPFVFEINDISYSGLGIQTNVLLKPNAVLYFRMEINYIQHEFKVKVVWSKYSGIAYLSGVTFVDVRKEEIVFLHEIIKRL